MSITYEEALATLEAMFGEPWSRKTLDVVLRHEKGHMENTCDRILNHGSQDPQNLIDRLKSGGPEPQIAIDEELARQLAVQQEGRRPSASNKKKERGTPTKLPDDFLRIPGYRYPKRNGTTSAATGEMDDETLARMLQDELFSQELARNPDFAHLARGRPAAASAHRSGSAANSRQPSFPAARRSATGAARGVDEGPKIMEKMSGM
jgi:hypothetical protein